MPLDTDFPAIDRLGALLGGALRRGLGKLMLCSALSTGRGLHHPHSLATFTGRHRSTTLTARSDRCQQQMLNTLWGTMRFQNMYVYML